jgi:hypothetical protein
MATQFPQDPNAGRFIDGLKDQQVEADEGIEYEMPPEDAEVEELPDGSAIVHLESVKMDSGLKQKLVTPNLETKL